MRNQVTDRSCFPDTVTSIYSLSFFSSTYPYQLSSPFTACWPGIRDGWVLLCNMEDLLGQSSYCLPSFSALCLVLWSCCSNFKYPGIEVIYNLPISHSPWAEASQMDYMSLHKIVQISWQVLVDCHFHS